MQRHDARDAALAALPRDITVTPVLAVVTPTGDTTYTQSIVVPRPDATLTLRVNLSAWDGAARIVSVDVTAVGTVEQVPVPTGPFLSRAAAGDGHTQIAADATSGDMLFLAPSSLVVFTLPAPLPPSLTLTYTVIGTAP